MARYVIDAETLLHLVDRGLVVHSDHRLVAPNAVLPEALEVLLRDVRQGTRTEAAARQVHRAMTETKIRLLGDSVSRTTAWRIAREQDWSTLRDAAYLAVTRLQADALATVDEAMAARAAGIVPVVPFDALLIGD